MKNSFARSFQMPTECREQAVLEAFEKPEDTGSGAQLHPPTQGSRVTVALPSCTAPSEAPTLLGCHHREREQLEHPT